MKMTATVCIDASQEKVWAVLADVVSVEVWVEQIDHAYYGTEQREGVGTRRVCELGNGMTIKEVWVEWVEGEAYTYTASGMPMIETARNRWSIVERDGKSYLTSEAELIPKWGLLGRMVVPVFRWWSGRLTGDSLARFKYLAEHGRPFAGDPADLPVAAAVC